VGVGGRDVVGGGSVHLNEPSTLFWRAGGNSYNCKCIETCILMSLYYLPC
jgi:hypothetical protein